MPTVRFSLPLVKGKGRPRARRAGGFVKVYTDPADKAREREVCEAFKAARAAAGLGADPADGPCALRVWCEWPVTRGKGCHFLRRPDGDNVLKSVADALNGVAWMDDSQVVRWECTKLFRKRGERGPRTYIRVEWGADAPSPESPWEG